MMSALGDNGYAVYGLSLEDLFERNRVEVLAAIEPQERPLCGDKEGSAAGKSRYWDASAFMLI